MTESSAGEVRYLLADGLGSVRQALDETAAVVAYHEFDPYGNPTDNRSAVTDYGFTGEWWQAEVGLLHLRARWYAPGDPVQSVLRLKTRAETTDPEGGGAMTMIFNWHELYTPCEYEDYFEIPLAP